MCNQPVLIIPNTTKYLVPGNRVKLGKFDVETWLVQYGWYAFDGNRSICCWYLTNTESTTQLSKPLTLSDLDDIYVIVR